MKPDTLRRLFTEERVEDFRRRYRYVNVVAALAGLTTFLLLHGQVLSAADVGWVTAVQGGCVLAFIGEIIGVYIVARSPRLGLRQSFVDSAAFIAGGVLSLMFLLVSPAVAGAVGWDTIALGFGYLLQAAMMLFVIARVLRALSLMTRLADRPLRVFALSFIGIILFGMVLLLLPGATHKEGSMGLLNALFLSTSATCVTGLSTLDVGTELTVFGQLVLLGLMQIGGLGIMTFAGFFSLAFGRGMGVRDTVAMGSALNVSTVGRVGRTTAWIVGLTVTMEVLGVVALYGRWLDPATGAKLPAGEQIYHSVFHSISAFCNAGFSLNRDSLVNHVGDWGVILPVMGLVVLGGIGFSVTWDLCSYRFWAMPAFRRLPLIGRKVRHQRLPYLSLQTKIVVIMTLVLIVGGALVFWMLERDGVLRNMPVETQVAASLFHSITPRTAGFNTVQVSELRPATNFMTMLLMIIGGSPGGTSGGLKTTTVAVLFLSVLAMLRGRDPEVFRRRVPEGQTRKSLVMLVSVLSLIAIAVFALMLCEIGTQLGGVARFEALMFEVVSAFCTVGLSMGITSELTEGGKLIIIACMFVGRVGPLTLVLAMGPRVTSRYRYPDEEMMIG